MPNTTLYGLDRARLRIQHMELHFLQKARPIDHFVV